MQRRFPQIFAAMTAVFAAVVALSLAAAPAGAEEVTSRMRSVSGVFESNGYRIVPIYDFPLQQGGEEHTEPQAYEIIRPDMNQPLTVGRLFTSCSCIRLESEKRTFGPGERAVLVLRNIRPTPPAGQMYAFFVQMREPLDTTLRFDTFIQSGVGIGAQEGNPAAATSESYPKPAETNPVPGLNNQLAAALSAVDTEAEATADLLAEGVEAAAEAVTEAAAGLTADLDADLPDFDAAPAAGTEAEAEKETEAKPAAPAATADRLSEEQVLQLQQLALIQAEEQAKQLAQRVQELGAVPAGKPAAPAAGSETETAAAAAPRPSTSLAGLPVQSVSLITIGVKDMPASIRFYESLGWQRAARGKYDQTAFFQLNGQVLALYPVAGLLAEQNMEDARPAPGGITLALHVKSKEAVMDIYNRFIDAGGKSLRAPAEMASGAVSSYVADPDGNPWEISWVPQFTLDANGGLWLP